jgi:hypothetical protein
MNGDLNASQNNWALLQESNDPNYLVLQGLRVDKLLGYPRNPREGTKRSKCCISVKNRLGCWFLHHSRIFEVSWTNFLRHCLVMSPRHSTHYHPRVIWAYLGDVAIESPNLIYFLKFLKASSTIDPGDPRTIDLAMNLHSRDANFYVTDTQAIGIGPSGMERGDVMCASLGGQTPFVLQQG